MSTESNSLAGTDDEKGGEWTQFFPLGQRMINWSCNFTHQQDIDCLTRLLSREGALIKGNLTLIIDEANYSDWYPSNLNLKDFLTKYGAWFSVLHIETVGMSPDRYHPLPEEKIEHIRDASRIPSIIIEAPTLERYTSLLCEPHVRSVELERMRITETEVTFFRGYFREGVRENVREKLTLCDCKFSSDALQILHDDPIPNIHIIIQKERAESIVSHAVLRYLPVEELSFNIFDTADDLHSALSALTQFSSLERLSLPSETSDPDLEMVTRLTNLVELDITLCHDLTERGISFLSHLPKLRVLDICNNYSTNNYTNIKMTPRHCELLVKVCPLLERISWFYTGNANHLDRRTLEMLLMLKVLAQLRRLKTVSILYEIYWVADIVDRTFIEDQLSGLSHPTLKSITVGGGKNLLKKHNQILGQKANDYIYSVFILIKAWIQREGAMIVLPKDVIIYILTEHAPLIAKTSLEIKEMVEFIWNHWKSIESLVRSKRKFKLVQSHSGNVKLAVLTGNKWIT